MIVWGGLVCCCCEIIGVVEEGVVDFFFFLLGVFDMGCLVLCWVVVDKWGLEGCLSGEMFLFFCSWVFLIFLIILLNFFFVFELIIEFVGVGLLSEKVMELVLLGILFCGWVVRVVILVLCLELVRWFLYVFLLK